MKKKPKKLNSNISVLSEHSLTCFKVKSNYENNLKAVEKVPVNFETFLMEKNHL